MDRRTFGPTSTRVDGALMIENFIPQPGKVFHDEDGSFAFVRVTITKTTGEALAVVERDGELETIPYDKFVYDTQAYAPPLRTTPTGTSSVRRNSLSSRRANGRSPSS